MKILIVDDEFVIKQGIRTIIERAGKGWSVIGEANDGEEALEAIEKELPDIILTDIRMPEINGIELMKKISWKHPDILFVVISGYAEFEFARERECELR